MKKNAVITVKSRISIEEDAIEVVTPGEFVKTEDGFFKVEYEETELSGMEGTKTTMIIKDNSFELIRNGTTETQMKFEKDKESVSLYKTPYGAMGITLLTKNIEIDVNEDGGVIDVVYSLDVEEQQKMNTILKVIIKV